MQSKGLIFPSCSDGRIVSIDHVCQTAKIRLGILQPGGNTPQLDKHFVTHV
jgi:hypothetical protein